MTTLRRFTAWTWLTLCLLSPAAVARANPDPPADTASPETASPETASPETAPIESQEDYYELFELFVDSMDQIERNYVKPVDRRELVEAAIEGMLGKLDPYSSYVPPEELAEFRAGVESSFGGIGLQVAIEEGQLKVLSPLVGSPAYKAGIIAGDRITQIDGESTDGITMDAAVKKLKGEVGSRVTLTVKHADREALEAYVVEREIVRVDTVLGDRRGVDDSWDFMYDEQQKIGYIRVTAFGRETAADLRAALDQLVKRQARGLILDLRFNPGGLLTSAIEVSDMFLDTGNIVSTAGRNAPRRSWEATAERTFPKLPLVVLINRYSASASEIVAASLQDNGRALIVGERTWGKGSVQNVIELEGGKSILKLTTASYRRPNGENIHRFGGANESEQWGVAPDAGYRITLSTAELGQLLRERRLRDVVAPRERDGDPDHEEAAIEQDTQPADDAMPVVEVPREEFVDRQLQKAVAYLSGELARAE